MDGFLHAILLPRGGVPRMLDWTRVTQWQAADGFLWLHGDFSKPGFRSWLAQQSDVPAWAAQALVAQETRPRVAQGESGLLILLREANLAPGAMPEDMVSLRLWLTPDRVVSCQRRPLQSVVEVLHGLQAGPVLPGHGIALATRLADRILANLEQVVDALEEQAADYDDQAQAVRRESLLDDMSSVRRRVTRLRRYLMPQREALARLHDHASPHLTVPEQAELREVVDRSQRLLEDLNAVWEQCVISQEDLSNRIAAGLNRRMYVLALVSLLFLPLTFLTGLLGVNLAGIPQADHPWAFPVFCAGLGALTVLLALVLQRRFR